MRRETVVMTPFYVYRKPYMVPKDLHWTCTALGRKDALRD